MAGRHLTRSVLTVCGGALILTAVWFASDHFRRGSANLADDAPAVVAPVFEHGEGDGIQHIRYRVLISDGDGLEIVKQELNAAGLNLIEKDVVIAGALIPPRRGVLVFEWIPGQTESRTEIAPGEPEELFVRLKDPGRKVAVEYISPLYCWRFPRNGYDISYRRNAEFLREQVRRSGKGVYFGVFYEPVVRVPGKDWTRPTEEEQEVALREAKRLLRLQAKDFIEWLRSRRVL